MEKNCMSKGIVFRTKNNEKVYPCPYFPIGSIYLSVNNTNPGSVFGGTWERIKDKFLLTAGDSYSAGSTGGEATHTLNEYEIPSHRHQEMLYSNNWNGGVTIPQNTAFAWYFGWDRSTNGWGWTADNEKGSSEWVNMGFTQWTGGNQAHNNMPPYLVVYAWKRVS